MSVAPSTLDELVARALAEDVGDGDLTSDSLFGPDRRCSAVLLVKQPGVVCGGDVAEAVFRALDSELDFELVLDDGATVCETPAELARLEGCARAVLAAERTALNLLGRLSGIATLVRRYVDAVAGTGVVVLDTRKTTPGLRELEKYAVRCGGAANHRLRLDDAVLVKDNHLRLAGGIASAVRQLRAAAPGVPIEVEVETLEQLDEALTLGVERVLLDNMSPSALAEAVRRRDAHAGATRTLLEASGGVTLDTVRTIAETGVDAISVGALTHSAPALDVSLEVER